MPGSEQRGGPRRQLSLFDATCIIVGIIIGAGIYKTTPDIAALTGSTAAMIGVWLAGGAMAVVGALCYTELVTSLPRQGGDYVFLTEAYGRRVGFLFAWSEFWIVRPGNVGMMAFVFAEYARQIVPLGIARLLPAGAASPQLDSIAYAAGAVLLLTLLNMIGVRTGKWTQNVLTVVKVAGLLAIVAVALFYAPAARDYALPAAKQGANIRVAFILVMFTYGGWNDLSFVAAEVKRPERNVPASLLGGILIVGLVYMLASLAFIWTLGFDGVAGTKAVAAEAMERPLGRLGGAAISGLVCASCLGAINGMMFAGSRVYYAVGRDHPLLSWLHHWSKRFDAPVRSLAMQCLATLTLICGFGWYDSGFEQLLKFTAPVFWMFVLMAAVSLFVLRHKLPESKKRPFRVPLYPWIPLAFCLSAAFMLIESSAYAVSQRTMVAWVAVGVIAAGLLASFAGRLGASKG